MPKENTHLHFAEKTRKMNPELANLIDKNLNYFRLGSVTPDAFFYSKNKAVFDISDHLHGKEGNLTNKFIFDLLDHAKKNRNEKLLVFMLGYITHCCLDIIFHPVIFYLTGNYHSKDFEKKEKAVYQHRRFEVLLDKKVNSEYHFANSIDKSIYEDDELLTAISSILNISKVDVQLSFLRQFNLNKVFKNDLLHKILKILNKLHILNYKNESAFFYGKLANDLIIPEEIEYKDLLTGVVSKKSLVELFDLAHSKNRFALLSAYKYYLNEESREQAEQNIAGESLDTGKIGFSVDQIKFLKE